MQKINLNSGPSVRASAQTQPAGVFRADFLPYEIKECKGLIYKYNKRAGGKYNT